jgi:hypothetical protein
MTEKNTIFKLNPKLKGKFYQQCHVTKEFNCDYQLHLKLGDGFITPTRKSYYLLNRKIIKDFIERFIYMDTRLILGYWYKEDCLNKGHLKGCKSSRTYFKLNHIFAGKIHEINLCKKCFEKHFLNPKTINIESNNSNELNILELNQILRVLRHFDKDNWFATQKGQIHFKEGWRKLKQQYWDKKETSHK